MAPINEDILSLIIDNVNDRSTLFSLLIVNKDVFRFTCRVLYRDPFCFLNEKPNNARVASLIRLLLSLSPAADSNANLLRRGFGVPQTHELAIKLPPSTMLDYLSFVRCVGWERLYKCDSDTFEGPEFQDWDALPFSLQGRDSFIRSTLTWCFCGHQLGQIRSLEIEPNDLERYVAVASQLGHLKTLSVSAFYYQNLPKSTYDCAVRLVQTLQHHHGKDLLQECRFSRRDQPNRSRSDFRWEVNIAKLLPLNLPHGLKLVEPLRPMDFYLSRIRTLKTAKDSSDQWKEILPEYLDMPVGRLLQRCRALIDLQISLYGGRGTLGDPNVFAWAVEEVHERVAGKLLVPAVNLQYLELSIWWMDPAEVLRVLMDSLRGFSRSLLKLQVTSKFVNSSQEDDVVRLPIAKDESVVMRRLESITFRSIPRLFDYRLVKLCPNLKELHVTLRNFDYSHRFTPKWPVIELPCLTTLMLRGSAIHLFDPVSLNGMPKLKVMMIATIFHGSGLSEYKRMMLDQWGWDWDWDLPNLTSLIVYLDPLEATFSLRILQHCPKLEKLSLRFQTEKSIEPYPIDVLSVLTHPTQDVFPNLRELELHKHCIQPEDFQALVGRVLPGLETISVSTVSPCTISQAVEFTRNHPSLRSFTIHLDVPDITEQQRLGLVPYDGCDDAERGCIYTFIRREDLTAAHIRFRLTH